MLYVRGCLIEADAPDLQGDVITKQDIKKININLNNAQFDTNHNRKNEKGCRLIENAIYDNAVTINNNTINPGSWIITVEVDNDELEQRITSTELNGFSLHGIDVENAEEHYNNIKDKSSVYPLFISFVNNPANRVLFEVLDSEKYIQKNTGEDMADKSKLEKLKDSINELFNEFLKPEPEEKEKPATGEGEVQKQEGEPTKSDEVPEENNDENKNNPQESKSENDENTDEEGEGEIKKQESSQEAEKSLEPGLKIETQSKPKKKEIKKKGGCIKKSEDLEGETDEVTNAELKELLVTLIDLLKPKQEDEPKDNEGDESNEKKFIVKSATGKPENQKQEPKTVESSFDAFGMKIRN